jgi:uncharacterized membrane protein YgdD (TMEM256/DUF423 family)
MPMLLPMTYFLAGAAVALGAFAAVGLAAEATRVPGQP